MSRSRFVEGLGRAEDLAVVPPYPWFLGALAAEGSAGER
jgi:hypothetical protein